jgi:hypothetical protein
MTWGLRSCVLAASAAALISTQAAYAAPVQTAPVADPLVSLSLLGTTQSRAAVCATGATCALPATTLAAATTTTAAAQGSNDDGKDATWLWLLGGGVILAIIIALILSGGNGDGDLTPISPD